jgi:hypothetical protein
MKIDRSIPLPLGRFYTTGKLHELRETIRRMKIGESFVWHENKHPYACADQVKCKIITRKIDGNGYRVWKVHPDN